MKDKLLSALVVASNPIPPRRELVVAPSGGPAEAGTTNSIVDCVAAY
jgi:hypothetical protein